MSEIVYVVSCAFERQEIAERWVAWLCEEHLADMCDAGALEAELVRPEGEPLRYEARYRYPSRQAFDAYEREQAPRLRGEGLKRFPPEAGLRYERRLEEVVAALTHRVP